MRELCGNTQAEIDNDSYYQAPIDRSEFDEDDSVVMLASQENHFKWVCETLLRGWSVTGRDGKDYSMKMYPNYDVKIVAALVVG